MQQSLVPVEESYTPAASWLKLRLFAWLPCMALLLIVAMAAGSWPVSSVALALLLVPATFLGRDLYRYASQRLTLIHADLTIRRGFLLTRHATHSLFAVQVSYRQSWFGEWLNYGDVIVHSDGATYHLRGISNIRALPHSLALRRAMFLWSPQAQPRSLLLPRDGTQPQFSAEAIATPPSPNKPGRRRQPATPRQPGAPTR
jgi:membrane protein YdbS with pleckstrin-like domain